MKKLLASLMLLCCFAFMAAGCKSKQADIEIGATRDEVIEKLGEPQGQLSGLNGDVYLIDGSRVTVYYEVNSNGDSVVSDVKTEPAD